MLTLHNNPCSTPVLQVENLQDAFTTHATRGADALQKLSEDVDMFVPHHSNLVMRGQDLAKRFHANSEAFVRVGHSSRLGIRQGGSFVWVWHSSEWVIRLGGAFVRVGNSSGWCICQGGSFVSVGYSSGWAFVSVGIHQCGHS